MSKFSSIAIGVTTAGLIVVTPAIAAGLVAPTQTRSATSMPTAGMGTPSSTDQPSSGIVDGRRQSPLLVVGDSPG